MSPTPQDGRPNLFPALRYQDAPAAIEWLVKAFGFEKQFVVTCPDGTIAHAQLKLGPGVIMLGTVKHDVFGSKTPREAGCITQSVYVHIPDIDAHHERSLDAGAEIVSPLKDTDYGSREYSARDPEGHVWHFGTYYPEDQSSADVPS